MVAANWQEKMGKVESFVRDIGRLPVKNARIPRAERDPREREIENWLPTQRRNRNKLEGFQIHRLEALPGFSWTPHVDSWESLVRDYGDFFLKHGKRPSVESKNKREKRLAAWGTEQRNLMREAEKRNAPSPERIAQLEAIPGFGRSRPKESIQQSRIDELATFVQNHGRPPKSKRGMKMTRPLTPEEEFEHSLSVWLAKRQEIARKGKLKGELRERLEEAYRRWLSRDRRFDIPEANISNGRVLFVPCEKRTAGTRLYR